MTGARRYPDGRAGPFEPPPRSVVDARGYEIAVHGFGCRSEDASAERAALAEMYGSFDPADRAQGIPPTDEPAIREWLDRLLAEEAVNVLAWDGDAVVGHAVLVPDDEGDYELAVFVHQDHQGAGIGTALVSALLGAGAAAGVERVWLTVERWNRAAIALYEGVGFETTSAESFELEMGLRLADGGDGRP